MTLDGLVSKVQRRIDDAFNEEKHAIGIAPVDQLQLDAWAAKPADNHEVRLIYTISGNEAILDYFKKQQIESRRAQTELRCYDFEATGKQLIELAANLDVTRILYR